MYSFDIYFKPSKTCTNRCHSRLLSLCSVKCLHEMSKFFLRAARGDCATAPRASPAPSPAPCRKTRSGQKYGKKIRKNVLIGATFVHLWAQR